MPTIGSETLVILNGFPGGLAQIPQEITRPHVDGSEFHLTGKRPEPVQLDGRVDCADAAAAAAKVTAYQALQGTIVTIVDAHGQSHATMMILKVRATPRAAR